MVMLRIINVNTSFSCFFFLVAIYFAKAHSTALLCKECRGYHGTTSQNWRTTKDIHLLY